MKDLLKYFTRWEKQRIKAFEKENGLIDGCKYMLYLVDDYLIEEMETSFPVKSIKEAKQIINDYCN